MNNVAIKLNILHIFCIVAVFQALLMAVVLFSGKKGNRQSNVILGFWLLSFAALMSSSFFLSYGVWQYFNNYHKPIFIFGQTALLIGPLFYFYTKSLLEENFRFKKKDLFHAFPFLIVVCYLIVRFNFTPGFTIWRNFMDFFSNGIFLLQSLIYFILIFTMLKKYGFSFKTFFSDKNNLKYNWIRFLIIGSFVIWVAKLQSFSFWYISRNSKWCPYTATTYFLALFLFVTSIVYVSLKKPIFLLFNKKYSKSGLSEKDKKEIKQQLLKYMNEEKLYLDQTLSLKMLAERLSISTNYLSQIINEMFNQNFNDFVNQYRVRECIDCLQDKNNGHKTLLRIAFESGFNTKATFNSAFKKFTGLTPKQFRKSLH